MNILGISFMLNCFPRVSENIIVFLMNLMHKYSIGHFYVILLKHPHFS